MPNIVTGMIDAVVSLEQIGGSMLCVNATVGDSEDSPRSTAMKYKLITPLKVELGGHSV